VYVSTRIEIARGRARRLRHDSRHCAVRVGCRLSRATVLCPLCRVCVCGCGGAAAATRRRHAARCSRCSTCMFELTRLRVDRTTSYGAHERRTRHTTRYGRSRGTRRRERVTTRDPTRPCPPDRPRPARSSPVDEPRPLLFLIHTDRHDRSTHVTQLRTRAPLALRLAATTERQHSRCRVETFDDLTSD
jgi:hypothetical protein